MTPTRFLVETYSADLGLGMGVADLGLFSTDAVLLSLASDSAGEAAADPVSVSADEI